MTPAEADAHRHVAAAYVHIPFCSAVCPYCDFAVVADRDDMAERYAAAVVTEIQRSEPWRPLDAVYVGGGTPSHVDPGFLADIIGALDSRHGVSPSAEISLEANPEDFDERRGRRLAEIGFNRVSFGAQSFDDAVLLSLGRRHVGSQIDESVAAARSAGFESVNLDLIYGTPVETGASWAETLERALALEPDHISAYSLTVEPGTELGRAVRDGAEAPDPDTQADRYELAAEMFSAAGLCRYEVSNWAHPGRECRYNLTVWAQGEYEAYGNGAHGHRNGNRTRNYRRLDSYIDAIESGRSGVAGTEEIRGWDTEVDRLFVGMRRVVGVSSGPGVDAFAASPDGSRLLAMGVTGIEWGRLVVRSPLLTDEVHRVVLGLGPPQGWDQLRHGDNVLLTEDA